MTVWDYIFWFILAVWVWNLLPIWLGLLFPRYLKDVALRNLAPTSAGFPSCENGNWPGVSIIVPARNESAAIENALRRLLDLDYPNYEVIAIDDRSTDDTGAIMDRVAGTDARCQIVHLHGLPDGWLGKNYANMIGAKRAQGDYLLFTDGDVLMDRSTLRRAVAAMMRGQVDHLAIFPDAMMNSFGESMIMNYFAFQFILLTKMYLVRFRWVKRAFVGIGAFNMLRRSAYEQIGTHERLRMEVADDLMMGKLVKDAGLKQDALAGAPLVRVKWQHGLWGVVRGLEKNGFAGARYSLGLMAFSIVVHLLIAWLPLVLIWTGPARFVATLFVLISLATHAGVAIRSNHRISAALLYPLAAIVFSYILARSAYVTLRDGGVTWRESFYPLAELRAGMIEWHPIGGIFRARRRAV